MSADFAHYLGPNMKVADDVMLLAGYQMSNLAFLLCLMV